MRSRVRWSPGWLVGLAVLGLLTGGCSIKSLAIGSLADALAAAGPVYAADDDPELVADALPFALKTMETLLVEQPDNQGLLLATAQGFTQYAYAFVQLEAKRLADVDYHASRDLRRRALGLYLRARGYALRALEVSHPGIEARLRRDPDAAVQELSGEEIDQIYWAGASWGAALGVGQDRPELLADLGAVKALLGRVLELEEAYDRGAIHEAFIALETLSPLFGGSVEKAKEHFDRALELSGGQRVGTFVAYAESIAVPTQDRAAYVDMLERALAVDLEGEPAARLQNVLMQRQAAWLLERVDDYFLSDEPLAGEDSTP